MADKVTPAFVPPQDLFVTYAREDAPLVEELRRQLVDRGRTPWIDRFAIPAGERWREQIDAAILSSAKLLFVISPASVRSEECLRELELALSVGKPLVSLRLPAARELKLPAPLAETQWVELGESLEEATDQLVGALDIDLTRARFHARLQGQVQAWQLNPDASRLLRGQELRSAEDWVIGSPGAAHPGPTDAMRDFVLASQREEQQRRRRLIGALTAALAITVALAVATFIAYRTAEHRRKTATSRLIASEAIARGELRQDEALLLAALAYRIQPTLEAQRALGETLAWRPRLQRYLHTHGKGIECAAAARETGRVVSIDLGGEIAIHEPNGERATRTHRPDNPPRNACAMSGDGRRLVAGGYDGRLVAWDLEGEEFHPLIVTEHAGTVSAVALNAGGDLAATGNLEGQVRLWSVEDGTSVAGPIDLPSNGVTQLRFFAGGSLLLAAGLEGRLYLLDGRTGTALYSTARAHEQRLLGLAIGDEGDAVATGGFDGRVLLWSVVGGRTLELRGEIQTHHRILAVDLSADGRKLATSHYDGTVALWDIGEQRQFEPPWQAHAGRGGALFLDMTGDRLVSIGVEDGRVIRWDSRTPIPRGAWRTGSWIQAVDIAPEGEVVAGDYAGRAVALNREGETIAARASGQPWTEVEAIRALRRHEALIVHGRGVDLWRFDKDVIETIGLAFDDSDLLAAGAVRDLSVVVAGDLEGRLLVWRPRSDSSERRVIADEGEAVLAVDLSDDGRWVVSGTADGLLSVHDVRSGVLIWRQEQAHDGLAVSAVQFVRGQGVILSAGDDGRLHLWHAARGERMVSRTVSSGRVFDASWTGKYVAVGDEDGLITMLDGEELRPVVEAVRLHSDFALAARVDTEGRRLVTAGGDGVLCIWDIDPASWMATACRRAGRSGLSAAEWAKVLPNERPFDVCRGELPGHPVWPVPLPLRERDDVQDRLRDEEVTRAIAQRIPTRMAQPPRH